MDPAEAHVKSRTVDCLAAGSNSSALEGGVDFSVLEHLCVDDTLHDKLGKHAKLIRWELLVEGHDEPLEVEVHVDKAVMKAPKVRVEAGSAGKLNKFFPEIDSETSSVLREDYAFTWNFVGTLSGMREPGFYEARPPAGGSGDKWYLATVLQQYDNDRFEVAIQVPDDSEKHFHQVLLPMVPLTDLREASTKQAAAIPLKCLHLRVPRLEPLHATLAVSIKDSAPETLSHFFARRSPPEYPLGTQQPPSVVKLSVDRDHTHISGPISYSAMQSFVQEQVCAISCQMRDKAHKLWQVSIGPNAKHSIELEKTSKQSDIITLTIDGKKLVTAAAPDIDWHTGGDCWECRWHFVCEKAIEFEVYETDGNGTVLESKATATAASKSSKLCRIRMPDLHDVESAQLFIEDEEFRAMRKYEDPSAGPGQALNMTVEAFRSQYGYFVPYKVHGEADCTTWGNLIPGGLARKVAPGSGAFWFFGSCCASDVDKEQETVTPHSQLDEANK